jgi:site-specific recombinase XerD
LVQDAALSDSTDCEACEGATERWPLLHQPKFFNEIRCKAPATAEKVLLMVEKAGTDAKGLRDRALLLHGFAGAFRRSELVALNVEDIEFCDGGHQLNGNN